MTPRATPFQGSRSARSLFDSALFGQLPLLTPTTHLFLLHHLTFRTCSLQFQYAVMSTTLTVTQAPAITAENVLRLFPEVNTTLIGASHNSATADDSLEGYDEEQIRLMDEVCIVLDENDIPIGSASKKVCESGRG